MRYGEVESAEEERTVDEMVSGDFSGGMYTISGLSAATLYTVEVAAETSAGTGPYSQPVNIETPDSEYAAIYGGRSVSKLHHACVKLEYAVFALERALFISGIHFAFGYNSFHFW